MCCFLKVCPVPTLLRCEMKDGVREGLRIKCTKEEKEFVRSKKKQHSGRKNCWELHWLSRY